MAIIGLVSLALSTIGVYIGCKVGGWLREWAPALGGAVLVFIGVRILVEHLAIAAV